MSITLEDCNMNSSQKIAKDMNVLLPDSFAERPHYRCSSFAMHFTEL